MEKDRDPAGKDGKSSSAFADRKQVTTRRACPRTGGPAGGCRGNEVRKNDRSKEKAKKQDKKKKPRDNIA